MQRSLAKLVCLALAIGATTAPRAVAAERGGLLARALAGPLKDSPEIVFTVRMLAGDGHFYASYSPYPSKLWGDCSEHGDRCPLGDAPTSRKAAARNPMDVGGQLCRLNLRTGELKVLLDDPAGSVRDVCVHYDGKRILFAYRPAKSWYFHLYEIDADGSGLKQLTDGPYMDGECTYLPDGGIAFTSTRANRAVGCYHSHVHLMYRCDADGKHVRPLSSGTFGEHTPWMLPDGRILYNRWDYTDRSNVDFHGLWAMRPDGSASTAFYGNSAKVKVGHCFTDPRPVPGDSRIVCTYHPNHGSNKCRGAIALIDPTLGPDAPAGMRILIGDPQSVGRRDKGAPPDIDYSDPLPLGHGLFLVCHNRNLLLVDERGNREVVFSLKTGERNLAGPDYASRIGKEELDFAKLYEWGGQYGAAFLPLVVCEPMVLRARPREPVLPSSVDLSRRTGTVLLADVYRGRNMEGVKPGSIRRILVIAELPMVRKISGFAPDSDSVWALKEVIGTMNVEEDGSAYAELPAMKSLQFIALDAQWRAVKRMHSFVTLQPGEAIGCVGCHERRETTAPPRRDLLAMQRSSRLDTAVSGRIDYAKTIQPIWDRHCVSCHSLEKYEGKLDLSGAPAASFMPASYSYLRQRGMLPGKNNIITRGDDKPYAPIGSATGKLDPFLSAEHHGVRLSDLELRTIRHWMDCGALNAATYGAWGHVRSGPECTLFDMARQGLGICMNCHGNAKGGKNSDAHLAVKAPLFNLAKPEKSLLVLAPLMAEQGGLGLCRATDGKAAVVFAKGKDDPLYKAALGQCAKRAAKQDWHAAANYRLDKAYVVQMKRFGILPADFDETAPPPDPYDLDRQYYESHWKPLAAEPEATSSGETLSNNTRATR